MSTYPILFCVVFAVYCSLGVEGHGYMLEPINRASLWRIDWNQPANYNDNEYFCGGTRVQYVTNEGKCGPCGDDWRDPVPRSNENGGAFGNGVIVANYTAGEVIEVTSLLTANHLGSLYFQLCELQDPSLPETEECFLPLRLEDGTQQHRVLPQDMRITTRVRLPNDFTCERCVLRWHYRTGNSWGFCNDGTHNVGCGDQEIFRSCADIRITSNEIPDGPPTPVVPPTSGDGDDVPPEQPPNNCNQVPSVPIIPADPLGLILKDTKKP